MLQTAETELGLLNSMQSHVTEKGEVSSFDPPWGVDSMVGGPPHRLSCCLCQLHSSIPVRHLLHTNLLFIATPMTSVIAGKLMLTQQDLHTQ